MNANKITIFDQACLHKTKNKNCGIRLSIDFGIILKENISKKILLKRYKDRFIKNYKNLPIINYEKGDAVIYSGDNHLHGLLPVTKGERYVLIFFFDLLYLH